MTAEWKLLLQRTSIISELFQTISLKFCIFYQPEGASLHSDLPVRELLVTNFNRRWIRTLGLIQCALRSPDRATYGSDIISRGKKFGICLDKNQCLDFSEMVKMKLMHYVIECAAVKLQMVSNLNSFFEIFI